MMVEGNILPLFIEICNFLEDLKDTHLKPFLSDGSSTRGITHSVLPHSFPVLSYY